MVSSDLAESLLKYQNVPWNLFFETHKSRISGFGKIEDVDGGGIQDCGGRCFGLLVLDRLR